MKPGTQLGSYEILSPLGKGGMGEVWRARDQKLGREVAIKTLPEEFAKDEERLARFEREAKLLASLNHPNIAAIYGLEEDNGTRFLVLELVEGDTLADRLKRGAIPVEESLNLALQIAEALEAAHEKGVIHRDLKPANIKVTPEGKIKVLDFGLAKAFAGDGSDVNLSHSPTLSMQATQQGVILGTAAYMSPEQARGVTVDKRADIWAFGCVLYEMFTGRQVFKGELMSDVMASVLKSDPDYKGLPPTIHPKLRDVLRRCLEKEPKQRWQDVGDVRVELEQVLADPSGTSIQLMTEVAQAAPRSRLSSIALTAALSVVLAGVTVWNLKPEPPKPVSRFPFVLPDGQSFTRTGRPLVAVSPDGTQFVYVADGQLYLRSLNEMEARSIPGTDEDVSGPFFSPDGQWVGYYSNLSSKLKKIAITGGASIELCDTVQPFGASWSKDGSILFALQEGIMSVPDNGGEPIVLIQSADGERSASPQLLPGGDAVLFSVTGTVGPATVTRWDEGQVVVESLSTGVRKVVANGGSDGKFVSTGHVVYALESSLLAVPFDDLGDMEATGGPISVLNPVRRANGINATPSANYAISETGSLLYAVGGSTPADRILALASRNGNVEPLNVPNDQYLSPRLSPDGTKVAVQIDEDDRSSVWVYDLAEQDTTIRRLTLEGNNYRPIWSPDSEWVAFASDRDGPTSVYRQRVDGSGVQKLTTPEEGTIHYPESWSPDDTLSFQSLRNDDRDIWTLSLDNGTSPRGLAVEPESQQMGSAFSRDGKWIAYSSSPDAAPVASELYIQPFPPTGDRYEITRDTGVFPVWAYDGRELFYRPTGAINSLKWVGISTQPAVRFSGEEVLPIEDFIVEGFYRDYDITPAGDKFIVVMPARQELLESNTNQINIVLNWFEELKERVPVP